jgi:hypothetical protein
MDEFVSDNTMCVSVCVVPYTMQVCGQLQNGTNFFK